MQPYLPRPFIRSHYVVGVIFSALILSGTAANAALRWKADFGTQNIKGFWTVQCGGRGDTCPCRAGHFDAYDGQNPPTDYDSGQCRTSTTMLPAPEGGRFQIVPSPSGRCGERVLRVNLQHGDTFKDATRNELLFSIENSAQKHYAEGEDQYFAWSTYFPSDFARWTCETEDTECATSNYNPWNVITQWHSNTDGGRVIGMALRRYGDTNQYRLILGNGYLNSDIELWTEGTPIQLNTWYDFVVHVHFGSSKTTGYIELWVGKNGAAKTKQTLSCFGDTLGQCQLADNATRAEVATMNANDPMHLKQGLYRDSAILDNVTIYHADTRAGDTYDDVARRFQLCWRPILPRLAHKWLSPWQPLRTDVTLISQDGWTGDVDLSAIAPQGINVSFSASSVTVPSGGAATATLSMFPEISSPGDYVFDLSASSGTASDIGTIGVLTIPAVTPPPASSVQELFANGGINEDRWLVSTHEGTASASGGSLRLTPDANTGNAIVAVASANLYSLIGSAVHTKAPGVVSSSGNVRQEFALRLDAKNYLEWRYQAGGLSAYAVVDGNSTTVASLTYSATSHLWLRIRESLGAVYWETSSDGTTWMSHGSVATSSLFDLVALKLQFFVETFGTGNSSPGVAQFSNLNFTSNGSNPEISTLYDAFAGSSINPSIWEVKTTNGSTTEASGTLTLAPNANSGGVSLDVKSKANFTLTDSSAHVQAPSVVSSAGGVAEEFALVADQEDSLKWRYDAGNLYAFANIGGTLATLATLAYSSSTHAWWRIREASGSVFWETSSDGSTWTTRATRATASLFPLSEMRVVFRAESYGAGAASPGTAKFANFNRIPHPALASLADSFPGTSVDSTKWNVVLDSPSSSVAVSSGVLTETPETAIAGAGAHLISRSQYAFNGSSAFVHVKQVVAANGKVVTRFGIADPVNTWIDQAGFSFEAGILKFFYTRAGNSTTVASVTYSSTSHAWWRLRESSGTVYWETSSDGSTWTARASTATTNLSVDPSNVVLLLSTKELDADSSPGSSKFSSLNTPPSGNPSISSLVDRFDGPIDTTRWVIYTNGAGSSVSSAGGVLTETLQPSFAGAKVILQSSSAYSLRGSSILVQVPQVVSSSGNQNTVLVVGDATDPWDYQLGFWFESGDICFFYQNGAGPIGLACPAYSSANDKWWRLREESGAVYWDTSTDGLNWTSRASTATSNVLFDLSSVVVMLSTAEFRSDPAPGTSKFSNLNAP